MASAEDNEVNGIVRKEADPSVHKFTPCSIPLRIYRGSAQCFGTGFLYLHGGKHYLVTAWHNVSGRNFVDKQAVSAGKWLPSHMRVTIPIEELHSEHGHAGASFSFEARLYLDDEETKPIWLVDKDQGSRIDIAVVPLISFLDPSVVRDATELSQLRELGEKLDGSEDFKSLSYAAQPARLLAHRSMGTLSSLEIAQDVYVVGFPDAIAAAGGLPIWKRGSIASEPTVLLQGRPCFLIDSATRQGLSGAPVVARYERPQFDNDGKGVLTLIGTSLGFCGLYTSRLGKTAEGAQLGIVWRQEAIETVIQSGIIGKPSNDFGGLLGEGGGDLVI